MSPNIPPPLSAKVLAFLSGSGSILTTSPVVGSGLEHPNIKKLRITIKSI
jgi:hypothetical protein